MNPDQHPAPPSDGPTGDAAPEQVIDLSVRHLDGARVVAVSGEVDMLTTPTLRTHLQHHLDARPDLLVVDLSGVTFLGSSGLAVLVAAAQRARESGVPFRLVCTTRAVIRPLTATGLVDVLDIRATVREALGDAAPTGG
ncbi:anti-sigma B factor antagonist [Streptoalloteichus tenebrarius]|uniref:Anti-sigma factor antagonist n=1 Tax=Streptoalloteichus tenebrarius (strain ATCC 17920 / DSM 40477 / JCM 4838 / CBS 697.72 / NBRC 16177 / NCIMB 11028 / NRRL B-12390 / A12253. 1 / ISP 5477) TaxID=1933 RepID=A0ABT1HQB0_STRSD|nr:STAS domain-containing protein [Streptoalloteichus tenebrarius]MCP2257695.1 anti-sigma B factor antagonist [Streptoalloteichus tenebrarius]BFE99955.1 STAS domain-containing protein [Streptoalloteichus tenebrarius]